MQQNQGGQNPPPQPQGLGAAGDAIRQFNQLVSDSLAKLSDTVFQLDKELAQSQASIAGLMGQTQMAIVGIREELTLALPGIAALGGSLADAVAIQKGITQELQTNIVLLGETTEDLFVASRAVGVLPGEVGKMVGGFQDAGINVGLIRDRMEQTVDIARRVGVNTTAVFQMVQENLSRLNQFGFQGGVEGLAKMAATSAAMRVNMNEVFDFASRVFSPEGSIEMVAAFQRLGVATGDLADPFRLMYLASEDVDELNNQVVKMTENFTYFDEETKEFKVFPNAKRDLREIENATGIAYSELVKMSIAQQKLNQITGDFRIMGVSEEDKQFVANVAEFNEARGGFTVKIGKDEKLVSELNPSDLEQLKESTAPVTLEDLGRAQLDETRLLNATMNSLVMALAGPTAASKAFTDPREIFRGAAEGIQQGVTSAFGNQRQAQADVNKFISEFGGSLTDILAGNIDLGKISGIVEKAFGSLETGIGQISDSFMNVDYKGVMEKYVSSGNIIYEGAQKAAQGFDLLTQEVKDLSLSIQDVKKPEINVVPSTTKVEFADINYTGNVNVKLETPGGATQNFTVTDQMAYDLFQNPTFQKMNQMALQNAMSAPQYSALPNRAMS